MYMIYVPSRVTCMNTWKHVQGEGAQSQAASLILITSARKAKLFPYYLLLQRTKPSCMPIVYDLNACRVKARKTKAAYAAAAAQAKRLVGPLISPIWQRPRCHSLTHMHTRFSPTTYLSSSPPPPPSYCSVYFFTACPLLTTDNSVRIPINTKLLPITVTCRKSHTVPFKEAYYA